MPTFHAIVAMAENRVIGDHGRIPWRLPEDFRWFKHKTMGGTLIMGRKTREAIGRELPGRTNLVLTRNPNPGLPDSKYYSDPKKLITDLASHATAWVVGGADIYREFLPLCTFLYLTRVKLKPQGDVLFPAFEQDFRLDQVIHEAEKFQVERWVNKKPAGGIDFGVTRTVATLKRGHRLLGYNDLRELGYRRRLILRQAQDDGAFNFSGGL